MAYDLDLTPTQLASVYAGYFAKDYAEDVLSNLKGSYPIEQQTLSDFVNKTIADKVGNTPITLGNDNAICRFLFELAEHALEQGIENPDSYAAFEHMAALPSIHHSELGSFVYQASDLYNKTLDATLMGVVAKDANVAAEAIVQAVQSRTSLDNTGGTLKFFSWGILNDGLWMNGALLKAYKLANIFRPGDAPSASYAQTAFQFARQFSHLPMMDADEATWAPGELDSLLSYVTTPDLDNLLTSFSQESLVSLLFSTGDLANKVRKWEQGMTSPYLMVESIQELSAVARLLDMLGEAYKKAESDMAVSSATKTRIDSAYNTVVLVLAGYAALRDTKFNEALILDVYAQGNDPQVDVTVNKDVMRNYYAAGGEDEDLIRFGLYLDPRKGSPMSGNGWSLPWVMARRDDVIPKIMSEDADRLQRMRANDVSVIEQESMRIINDVVRSYLDASGKSDLRPDIRQKIGAVSRAVTRSDQKISLSEEIMQILLSTMDDPTVSSMGHMLINNVHHDAPNAKALTIAQMAATDVLDLITTAPVAE
jgi:hypothetical protein